MLAKIWKYAKRGLRVGAAAIVGGLVTDASKNPEMTVIVAAGYATLGKILRDKWPNIFGWLPIL